MDGSRRSRPLGARRREGPARRVAGGRITIAVVLVTGILAAVLGPGPSSSAHASSSARAASKQTLVEQAERLTDSESGEGKFGYSVALSSDGTEALVGAPTAAGGSGELLAFARSGASWSQQGAAITGAQLGVSRPDPCTEAASGEPDDCRFGRAIAISADGTTALVGLPGATEPCRASSGECADQGAAFVFTRAAAAWTLRATLTGGPEESQSGRFGRSVALSGDGTTALVGASSDGNGRGAAFVLSRSGSSWSHQGPKLTGGTEELGEGHLGGSVALSADGATALVGSAGDDSYAGAAWVFTRPGSAWSAHGERLTAGTEQSGVGHYGYSVALAGDGQTALVGARADAEGRGAVWAYARSDSGWAQMGPKLTAGPTESGAGEFGYSLALTGDGSQALIGAPREHALAGGAWLLHRAGSDWVRPGEPLETSGESGRSWLGASVAISGDGTRALAGAPTDTAHAGAVWTFASEAAPSPQLSSLTPASGPEAGATSVKISGTHLGAATAVRFGAAPAAFTVDSSTSLTATAPPGTGTVDVTVSTPAGASATTRLDRFTYTPTPKAPPAAAPPTSSPPSPGVVVAGFGPVSSYAPRGCAISLKRARVPVSRGGLAIIRLRATGAGTCVGRVTLTVIARRSHRRARITSIATRGFSIPAGRTLALRVRISALGRAMLSAAHGPIAATVIASSWPSSARVRLGTIGLVARRGM